MPQTTWQVITHWVGPGGTEVVQVADFDTHAAARREVQRLAPVLGEVAGGRLLKSVQLAGDRRWRAAGGAEALRRLRGGPKPCLLLLDLLMPVIDGRTFCEMLRADPSIASVPVIVISGAPLSLQHSGAIGLSVQEFHPKP